MNRKLCKKLRRRARALTEGSAHAAYRHTGELSPFCTKAVYHELKRNAAATRRVTA